VGTVHGSMGTVPATLPVFVGADAYISPRDDEGIVPYRVDLSALPPLQKFFKKKLKIPIDLQVALTSILGFGRSKR